MGRTEVMHSDKLSLVIIFVQSKRSFFRLHKFAVYLFVVSNSLSSSVRFYTVSIIGFHILGYLEREHENEVSVDQSFRLYKY